MLLVIEASVSSTVNKIFTRKHPLHSPENFFPYYHNLIRKNISKLKTFTVVVKSIKYVSKVSITNTYEYKLKN